MRKLLFLLFICCGPVVNAKVSFDNYGIDQGRDSVLTSVDANIFADSMVAALPLIAPHPVYYDYEPYHIVYWDTFHFYLLIVLAFLLGMIKLIDEKYFSGLWRALANRSLSSGKIKDQLEGAALPNLLMNLFFAISLGVYTYFIVTYYYPPNSASPSSGILITVLISGAGVIYLVKEIVVRFNGWAFRVEASTEQYLFNVKLTNKITGIVLLPFTMILAFGEKSWVQPSIIISFVVIGLLFVNRYLRSWQAFGAFVQYSKFHFFLYLCASEILPLAVLIKLLLNALALYM